VTWPPTACLFTNVFFFFGFLLLRFFSFYLPLSGSSWSDFLDRVSPLSSSSSTFSCQAVDVDVVVVVVVVVVVAVLEVVVVVVVVAVVVVIVVFVDSC